MVQAQAAVNAAGVIGIFGLVDGGEAAHAGGHRSDASHEAAGREDVRGIESVFQSVHERRCHLVRAPRRWSCFRFLASARGRCALPNWRPSQREAMHAQRACKPARGFGAGVGERRARDR